MCNLGALPIRLHQLVSGGGPVSVRASTRTGQVHSGHCGRRGQEESDAWSLKFRRRSLKFRHGVTVWCVAGSHCGSAGGGERVAPCQRLWRPSFHLVAPSLNDQFRPRSILNPVQKLPKKRHPSVPLIEVFSQSITWGDAIKAS